MTAAPLLEVNTLPPVEQRVNRPARAGRSPSRRAITYPPLTREQEYAFIRADLRRLLYTAGPLLALMLGLLFIIDR